MSDKRDILKDLLECYGLYNIDVESLFCDNYIYIDKYDEISIVLRKIFYPLVFITHEDIKNLSIFWNEYSNEFSHLLEVIKYFKSNEVVLSNNTKVSWDVDIICSIFTKTSVYTGICVIEDDNVIKHKMIMIPIIKIISKRFISDVRDKENFIERFYNTSNIVYRNILSLDVLQYDYTMCIIYNKFINYNIILNSGYIYGYMEYKSDIFVFSLYKFYIILVTMYNCSEYKLLKSDFILYTSLHRMLFNFGIDDSLGDDLYWKLYELQNVL